MLIPTWTLKKKLFVWNLYREIITRNPKKVGSLGGLTDHEAKTAAQESEW